MFIFDSKKKKWMTAHQSPNARNMLDLAFLAVLFQVSLLQQEDRIWHAYFILKGTAAKVKEVQIVMCKKNIKLYASIFLNI